MKTVRNILLILWCGFCIIGIVENFSHYRFLDWIVVFFVVIIARVLRCVADHKCQWGTTEHAVHQTC